MKQHILSIRSWLFFELVAIAVAACVVFDPAIVNLYYRHLPLGYDIDRLLFAETTVHAMTEDVTDPYDATPERQAQLIQRLSAVEGVEEVCLSDGGWGVIGQNNPSNEKACHERDSMYLASLSFNPDVHFFETYGLRPLAGSPSVGELSHLQPLSRQVVLTRSAAMSLFGREDVVGRRFQLLTKPHCDLVVAGVVEDVRMGLATSTRSLIMTPQRMLSTHFNITIRLKKGVNLHRFLEEHGAELTAQGQTDYCRISRLSTFREHLMEEEMDSGRQDELSRSLAMALFFLANIVLAVVGTVWLQAKRRTEECGVRRAFGATRLRLLAEFLVQGAVLATVTVGVGCLIFLNYAYSGLQTYQGEQYFDTMYCTFYASAPGDSTWVEHFWPHFLVIAAFVYLIILAAVLLGTAIPAWRICRLNITEALRE